MIGNHQWWLPIIDGYQSIPSMIRINDPHRQILMIGNHWFTTSHILVHWWSLQDRPYIIVHLSEAFRNILRFFDFWFIVDQLKSDHTHCQYRFRISSGVKDQPQVSISIRLLFTGVRENVEVWKKKRPSEFFSGFWILEVCVVQNVTRYNG